MKTLITSACALALAPFAAATTVNVTFSEDFAEKLSDDYGDREGPKLVEEITEDVTRQFEKRGLDVARVDVTILDAKPNRPTFQQQLDRPGLDGFRSISLGGMSLEGTAFDASGNEIGSKSYKYFENDIRNVIAVGTWGDARRASDRFARRFAKELAS
ncbi:MAG: hypothetical protein AAGJ85_01235 [Pseudomonadota bacterium]